MNLWISVLLGILLAILILRSTSTFNSGLGDRLPVQEVAPPPMAALEHKMDSHAGRIAIEGTDAMLIGVGLEAWHEPSKSIMDAPAPGSMANWIETHSMGPTPAAPGEPTAAVEKGGGAQERTGVAPPPGAFTGGGMATGVGGSVWAASMPPSAISGPTYLGAPPGASATPGAAATPSAADALAAWRIQQQKSVDAASKAAQNTAISQAVDYFTNMYKTSWLPAHPASTPGFFGASPAPAADTISNRAAFLQDENAVISQTLKTTPLSDAASRTTLMNQQAALAFMTSWATPPPPVRNYSPSPNLSFGTDGSGGRQIGAIVYQGKKGDPGPCKTACNNTHGCAGFLLNPRNSDCKLVNSIKDPKRDYTTGWTLYSPN